ncbi:MAG TPA: ABC transporter permease [Candidatus Dormibacteraeota bacterium]|jgi:putative ABC transport system permease protein|nr:ABC transporter permease [Candidatus Dormibacteraeota bacterium]
MSWYSILATGMRSLLGHRLRSILTTLGILFGVAAVICTVGIGEASAASVTSRIASLGTNLLTVTPGAATSSGVSQGAGTSGTLTMSDAEGLADRSDAPDIQAVAPVVEGSETLINGSTNWSTTVTGSGPGWLLASARTVSEGSFITAHDVSTQAHVAVLGSETASELDAGVGSNVTVDGVPFQVVGVLTSSGSTGFTDEDDLAVVPITTAQDDFFGGSETVERILLSASSPATLGSAYEEANDLLLQTHHIASPADADFQITSQSSVLSTAQAVTQTLTALLASVAAIALLVGGIGVMNIMLVSVTERTSEIGLRKAVGATPSDLFRQFVAEAAVLTLAGGLLGVAIGLLAGLVIPRLFGIAIDITALPVAIALAVSIAVGLVFGVYPASRAARLAPIEALRTE